VITIEGQVAEGDIVVTWFIMQGTHLGAFEGVAATMKELPWDCPCFGPIGC
jgi:predicted ester cyclase